jgi:hypothetical protein
MQLLWDFWTDMFTTHPSEQLMDEDRSPHRPLHYYRFKLWRALGDLHLPGKSFNQALDYFLDSDHPHPHA